MKSYVDRRYRSLIVLSAALMFFYGFFLGGLQLVVSEIALNFGVGKLGMGLLISVQHVTAVVMPILCGALADRVGKKPILLFSVLAFSVGCLLAGVSTGLAVYLAGAAFIGAGYSVCESVCSAVMSDIDAENSARYINLCQCLLSIGAVLAPQIFRLCQSLWQTDWRTVFQICAAAYLLLALLLWPVRFPSARKDSLPPVHGKQKSLLFSGLFTCLFVSIILYVGLENGFGYFMETLFDTRLGHVELASYAISAYWIGMAASRLASGLWLKRPQRVLTLCFLLSAGLFTALALSKTPWISLAVCGLIGVSFGPVWSTLVAEAANAFPRQAGAAVGLMSSGCGLGGILFPVLMGYLAERVTIGAAFLFLAITAALGMVLCVLFQRRQAARSHS